MNSNVNVPQELQELLQQRNTAILAIERVTAPPHVSPVWYVWDGDVFYFRIAKNTAKYRALQKQTSASLIINESTGYRYLAVYGRVEIIDPDDVEIAHRIARKYYPPARVAQIMLEPQEPDVVTVKLYADKIVATIEEIAQEAINSW